MRAAWPIRWIAVGGLHGTSAWQVPSGRAGHRPSRVHGASTLHPAATSASRSSMASFAVVVSAGSTRRTLPPGARRRAASSTSARRRASRSRLVRPQLVHRVHGGHQVERPVGETIARGGRARGDVRDTGLETAPGAAREFRGQREGRRAAVDGEHAAGTGGEEGERRRPGTRAEVEHAPTPQAVPGEQAGGQASAAQVCANDTVQ